MKGICRTVINAVHQSKCDNMEVRDTMRIAAMVFMLIILVGLFINAERQIFQGLNRPVSGMVFGLLVLTILAVFVVSRIPGMGAYGTLFLIDHYALGFLAYVVIITNAVSLLLFALRLTHLIQFPVSRSVRLVSAALSMLAGSRTYGLWCGSCCQYPDTPVSCPAWAGTGWHGDNTSCLTQ